MITVKPFNLEVLSTHKGFFLLDELPKHATEVDVWTLTPVGNESVDFVNIFSMADGSLLAAWEHPHQKTALHNLTVYCEGKTQILNLCLAERMINYYNRPVDSKLGTFQFAPSVPVSGDWRCDNSMYGPTVFAEENIDTFLDELGAGSELLVCETLLNINGTCHITYMEATNRSLLANEKLNNAIIPIVGRTFQELLRLIYEWSVLAKEPFNATDRCAIIADSFFSALSFTEEELQTIADLPQMQIGQFISGSESARQRPDNIPELSDEVENILWRRMGSSSLSFIVARNPSIWDFNEILKREEKELEYGITRFRSFYEIPEYVPLEENGRAVDFAEIVTPKHGGYIQTQLRGFKNKQSVLNKAIAIYEQSQVTK